MSFVAGVPFDGQSLGSSKTQVRNNFTSLRNTIAEDHVDVNDIDAGLHNKSTYVVQASDPSTDTGQVVSYSKEVDGIPELFFRRENDGNVIQMTIGTPIVANTGYTFLPGGLILQWVNAVASTNPSSFTFAIEFPNGILSANVTVNNNSALNVSATVDNYRVSGSQSIIDIYTTKTGVTHFVTAIGF